MSRSPGASCLQDTRSTGILLEYTINTEACSAGRDILARRNTFGSFDNCEPPLCGYDRTQDFMSIVGGFAVIANVIGVVHSMVVFFPAYVLEYNAGYLELCLVTAATYFFLIITCCCSSPVLEYAGHKLTALFGMIFLFLGLVIDSQAFHVTLFWGANMICVAVGGGLAYSAAMALPADLFRKKLSLTLLILNVSGSLGTILHSWLFGYLLKEVGFKWSKVMQAILVLLCSLAVHVFPKTRYMYSTDCDNGESVRECIKKGAFPKTDTCEDESPAKSMVCVCVCDLRLFGDLSFILWAVLVVIGTMMFHVAYLTINSYAETVGAGLSYWYITVYCLGSCAGRGVVVGGTNFTFSYNRMIFQVFLFASGLLWIILNWAVTFGWILVMCGMLGLCEGALCNAISRVTLGTIPNKWIGGAWVVCLLSHALGMFITVVVITITGYQTGHFSLGYTICGIIQIVVSLLAILLPSEDALIAERIKGNSGNCQEAPYKSSRGYGQGTLGSSKNAPCGGYEGGYNSSRSHGFNYDRYKINCTQLRSTALVRQSAGVDYKCNCSICSQYKCLKECLPDCTPGGSLRCPDSGTKCQEQ